MIQMLMTVIALWATILFAPTTPIGRSLRRLMVDRPATRLSRLRRGHLAIVGLAAVVIATVAWIGEGDGLRMLAMAAPEAATWLTTFEIATCFDVAIAAIGAWSMAKLRLPAMHSLLSCRRAQRQHRSTAPRRRDAANDDGENDRRHAA